MKYSIGHGGVNEPGLILIADHETHLIVARSSEMALKSVEELVRNANIGAETLDYDDVRRSGVDLGHEAVKRLGPEAVKWLLELPPESYRHFKAAIDSEREKAKRMVLEEREACAKIAEDSAPEGDEGDAIADKIRARTIAG